MNRCVEIGLGIIALYLAGFSHAQEPYTSYDVQPPDNEKLELSVCLDGGKLRHLSTDEPPDSKSCRRYYASCDEKRCMIVFNGAVKVMDRRFLQQFSGDLYTSAEQIKESGFPGTSGQPFNQWPEDYADPFCTWYQQMGFDCPEGVGLPGGGTNPGPSSTPFPPGENDGCTLCTLKYTACFVQAGPNPFLHALCVDQYQNCTMQSCG